MESTGDGSFGSIIRGLVGRLRPTSQLKPETKIPIVETKQPTEAKPAAWAQDSIVAEDQPAGGRSLKLYENILGFNRTDLEGKDVLDLGAGPEVKLSKELAESGIRANVIELSPDFRNVEYAQRAKNSYEEVRAIVGVGQSLPFAGEAFDRILVLHVLDHIRDNEVFCNLISEIGRTLRPGGKAYIGPTFVDAFYEDIYLKSIINNPELSQKLEKQGISVSHHKIPMEYFSTGLYAHGMRMGRAGGYTITLEKALK